ncbi:MAG TPA: NAD(P)/FAD-dependent oxidoreductase [Thermoleophilaceae bacterium]|nr:NAD(P)/FAD-dependent oxidoreductase [Thermoleophilaceae bacterium]
MAIGPRSLTERPFDVGVVGGGVAGVYAAHKLSCARPDWSIALFERSHRIGGRLLSVALPGMDGVRAELGGMRFRTSQPLVTSLVGELGLGKRPFRTVDDDNHFFLRGARWRAREARKAASVYRLDTHELDVSPAELLVAAFERVVPRASELCDDDWVAVKRAHCWRGRPLRHWTLGALLADVLSEEGHRYVLDGFGYATLLAERNAADAIPWILIEARPESENHTLEDGMERLPRQLAERFSCNGGQLRLGHELTAVEEQGPGLGLRLRFQHRSSVLAARVVLALPARPLDRVAARSALLDTTDVRRLIRSVTAHDAAKLFLAYERAWWRDGGSQALRAVTDLPLSKTYYFDRPYPDADTATPLLLASYSDGPSCDYWRALAEERPATDDEPYDSPTRRGAYAASPRQLEESKRQLALLHDRADVPDPVASMFIDWGRSDGAWHVWNAGVASWEVIPRIAQPLPGVPLYVCGESHSWSQGWVEGALESAEDVVRRVGRAESAAACR